MPATVALGNVALGAQNRLTLADRVKVVDEDDEPSDVASAGSAMTTLGVESAVGSVTSLGTVELRDRAAVHGDARSAGNIQRGNGTVIEGAVQANSPGLTPLQLETLEVRFPSSSLPAIHLNAAPGPDEVVTVVPPGRYTRLTAHSRNRIDLQTGEYTFDELQLEPQTRLLVDDAQGPVLITVRSQLQFKGKIESTTGEHPAVRIAYLGQNSTVIETPFSGTLIAPKASVRLASIPTPARHVGSFFAKDLEVSPDVIVEFRPFFQYQAEQLWEVSKAEHGSFGLAAANATGEVIAKTARNVVRVTSQGVATELLEPGHRKFRLDESSAAFGYYTALTFERYTPSGSLLGSLPVTHPTYALFVPGTTTTVIVDGEGDHKDARWLGYRVVTGSGSGSFVPTPGMQEVAVGQNAIVYSTRTELVCLELGGAERWRVGRPLRQLAISGDGSRVIGIYVDQGPRVVHVDGASGALSTALPLPSAPYAIGAAPKGEYTFTATKSKLFVFRKGALRRELDLPMAYFASADVNDTGEVVVGGADASGQTHLQVLGAPGTGHWLEDPGPVDQGAYRPHVRFRPGSTDFIAVRKSGLSSYTVTRRL